MSNRRNVTKADRIEGATIKRPRPAPRDAKHKGAEPSTVSVHVPLAFRRRGGRKHIVTPEGQPAWTPAKSEVHSTLVKALARAFRWQRLLDTGAYASIDELAQAERIGSTYLCRVLRLTPLAPDIIEAVLNGTPPASLTLDKALEPFPVGWEEHGPEFA